MRSLACVMTALAAPAVAFAQPVFVDHFSGSQLGWSTNSKLGLMEYTLSGGMLNVTRLYASVTSPGAPYSAHMYSPIPDLGDFHLRTVMGWDPGLAAMSVSVIEFPSIFAPIHARVGYSRLAGGTGTITATLNSGGSTTSQPAPPPGLYEFTLSRTTDTLSAWFNGELVLQAQDTRMRVAAGVLFRFTGPDSPVFGPLHVDFVEVHVPSPGPMTLLAGFGLYLRRPRNPRPSTLE